MVDYIIACIVASEGAGRVVDVKGVETVAKADLAQLSIAIVSVAKVAGAVSDGGRVGQGIRCVVVGLKPWVVNRAVTAAAVEVVPARGAEGHVGGLYEMLELA